jgi:hypothetical protein
MGRFENDIALQGSAEAQSKDLTAAGNKTEPLPTEKSANHVSPASTEDHEQFDTQAEEAITTAWEKTKHVAEQTLHAAEGAWEKTKVAAVAVKETIIGKPHANDEIARGKKNDDISAENAVHYAAAAAAGESPHQQHTETLKEKVQHIAGATWGKTQEVAAVAWEKTKGAAIAVKDKVIHEEIPAEGIASGEDLRTEVAEENTISDAPAPTPSLPSDAHPIAPTNQRDYQIDRKQLKVPVAGPADIGAAELPKDDEQLHADFERDQSKAPMRPAGGIGAAPPVSELTFGGGEPSM